MRNFSGSRRVLVIAVLSGVTISVSYYVVRPLDFANRSESQISPALWPLVPLSLLTIVPRILVARIIWEALALPGWLGELLFFLYWPCLGVVIGLCKHWVLWGALILTINVGLLAWFLYALSRMKIVF